MQKIGARVLILAIVVVGVIAYQFITARSATFETTGSGASVVTAKLTQGAHVCDFKFNKDIFFASIEVENEDIEGVDILVGNYPISLKTVITDFQLQVRA